MKVLKRIGIVGAGNVGSALVMELASTPTIAKQIVVASRNLNHAEATLLDAGSAFPETAKNFEAAKTLDGFFDVVVVTAGLMPHSDITLDELLEQNVQIVHDMLASASCKYLIVIGTPVDRLTERISEDGSVHAEHIIGFGGQLDVARTEYALLTRNLSANEVQIVGEHGPRMIPVYPGEKAYEDVRTDASTVLKRIGESGKARNMATGVQLARLVRALVGKEQTLCVSIPDSEFNGLSITWPYVINENGVTKRVPLELGPLATQDLESLIKLRNQEKT